MFKICTYSRDAFHTGSWFRIESSVDTKGVLQDAHSNSVAAEKEKKELSSFSKIIFTTTDLKKKKKRKGKKEKRKKKKKKRKLGPLWVLRKMKNTYVQLQYETQG